MTIAYNGQQQVPLFGTDISTFPVPDTTFSSISGFRALHEALCRRLLTRKGLLPFHPDYGVDLRQYLNESITDQVLSEAKATALAELRQDERVDTVDATVSYASSTQVLSFLFRGASAAGPFVFTLAVSQLTVAIYSGT